MSSPDAKVKCEACGDTRITFLHPDNAPFSQSLCDAVPCPVCTGQQPSSTCREPGCVNGIIEHRPAKNYVCPVPCPRCTGQQPSAAARPTQPGSTTCDYCGRSSCLCGEKH